MSYPVFVSSRWIGLPEHSSQGLHIVVFVPGVSKCRKTGAEVAHAELSSRTEGNQMSAKGASHHVLTNSLSESFLSPPQAALHPLLHTAIAAASIQLKQVKILLMVLF